MCGKGDKGTDEVISMKEEEINRRISQKINKLWWDGFLDCSMDRMLANIEIAVVEEMLLIQRIDRNKRNRNRRYRRKHGA